MQKILLFILIFILTASLFLVAGCDDGGVNFDGSRYVEFYAINDFHGQTDKMPYIADFLKQNKDGNTILLSSGDMFQGSIESNYNYGKLLDGCMQNVGFDCMTIGNHEFDWGIDKLQALVENSSVKYLGANIYHWDNDAKRYTDFADEIADPYFIKELDNGLKVGVIGIIGSSQYKSITSTNVATIGFKYPSDVVPDLAEELRFEKDCDVVVVSTHDSAYDTINDSKYLDMTEYVDAVFCAHSHNLENLNSNKGKYKIGDGVPFIQGGSNGEYISNVKLKVAKDGTVTCEKSENIKVKTTWMRDIEVLSLIESSNATVVEDGKTVADLGNEVLATISGLDLYSDGGVPRLACKAIAEYAKAQNVEVDLVLVNSARANLSGTITYADLYRALPFDNVVYVAQVNGSDLLKNAQSKGYGGNFNNSIWRVSEQAFNYNGTYTIAVIDYMMYHQNDRHYYDYFPSAFTSGVTPKPLGDLNYREITRDYLKSVGAVDSSEFIYTNDRTDNEKLQSAVTFVDVQATARQSFQTSFNVFSL